MDVEAESAAAGHPEPSSNEPTVPLQEHSPDSSGPAGPASIGSFELIREIGRGGQATVWLAEDSRFRGRRIALKLLRLPIADSEHLVARFQREARIAATIDHPTICPVHDAGIDDGVAWIAMRYVEGRPLSAILTEALAAKPGDPTFFLDVSSQISGRDADEDYDAPSTLQSTTMSSRSHRKEIEEIVRLFEEVARGLHAAHEAGVIHRDIKPGNLMVQPDGHAIILDFGLARDDQQEAFTVTNEGDLMGTPIYMSPEQIASDGTALDRRTDVYSLGVSIYEALSGVRPFSGTSRSELFHAIRYRIPPRLKRLNRAVDRDLDIVVEKAMQKDRDRRYQSALDLAEDLRAWLERRPLRAKRTPVLVRMRLWAQREPRIAALLVVIGGALLISLGLLDSRSTALVAEQQASARAERHLAEYDRMADARVVTELLDQATRLWPRRKHLVAQMELWLSRAHAQVAESEAHAAALLRMQSAARSTWTDADQAEDERLRRSRYSDLYYEIERKETWLQDTRYWIGRVQGLIDADDAKGPPSTPQARARREGLLQAVAGDTAKANRDAEELAALRADPRLTDRLHFVFDDEVLAWQHQVQAQLLRDLQQLAKVIPEVEARLELARTLHQKSITSQAAAWEACAADLVAHPRYGQAKGLSKEGLERLAGFAPIEGLVPLGKDRHSGLWEFWHVESGPRPPWTEAADWTGQIELPEGDNSADFGIVFVLLPGETGMTGVLRSDQDPEAGRFDDDSGSNPYVHHRLDPFLISKFEVTQSQWERLGRENRSDHQDWATCSHGVGPRHPVTNVNFEEALEACRWWGLTLPTEAQWEYAARAGSRTAYWCGVDPDSIAEHDAGNVRDAAWLERNPEKDDGALEDHDDDHEVHAPVGTYVPNPMGLHDMVGNVREWCRDLFGYYDVPRRVGDGLMQADNDRRYVVRGGSYSLPAAAARSAYRRSVQQSIDDEDLGFRPVMNLIHRWTIRGDRLGEEGGESLGTTRR